MGKIMIKENDEATIEVKKSKFIAYAARVNTIDEAQAMIDERRKLHWKARHHCTALMIGDKQEIQRSSDDGEPAGTAGVPILEVLKQQQMTDTLIVVTRYFGGIKLGKGGLIRAYSHAASQAIQEIGLVEAVTQQELNVTLDYSLFDPLQHYLENRQIQQGEAIYTDKITLPLFVAENEVAEVTQDLINQFNNRLGIVEGETKLVERPLLLEK